MTFRNIGYSQIAVVAIENETHAQVLNNNDTTENVNITLQIHETYVMEGMFDMTGTYIRASAKVFVLTGNSKDKTPHSVGGSDSFHVCLVPYSHWGRQYYSFPPFNMTSWIAVKIMSWESKNITVVQWRNGTQVSSSTFEPNLTFEISKDLGKIESPKYISAIQFAEPTSSKNVEDNADALSMFLIPSFAQFIRKYTVFPVFDISDVKNKATYYINLVLPLGGRTTDLYINNKTRIWQVVGSYSDGSTVVRFQLLPGDNLLENRGHFNITAVVSASHEGLCYTFSLS
ncbi:hypothetical protein HOLleu_17990 [Holothuria leucospilota]|uniref:IgGFc-binding protein N-terminal domain-containing protein n=1 Tax=Holothuria leucospilota TaxID=206669 RepID=A0A9Q1C238_HOLLE|nr:hypothetical protein HOLleu_17990 [Holothuria leucospilota]